MYSEVGMHLKINAVGMVIFAAALGVVIDSSFDVEGPAPLGRSIAIAVGIVATLWIAASIAAHFAKNIITSASRRRKASPPSDK
jgi:hypothetical protein